MTELTWQRKIGEILRERNVVSAQQLQEALKIQEMILKPIGKILIDMEVTTEEQIAEALAEQKGFNRISLKEYKINKQAIKLFPLPMARLHKALLVDFKEDKVVLAMADPLDVYAIDDVQMITGRAVEPVVCTESEILAVIDEYLSGVVHPSEEDIAEALKEALEEIKESTEGNIPSLVSSIIGLAAERQISEIYFEPREQVSRLRFRLNGDLLDMMVLKKEDHAAVIAHLGEMFGNDQKKAEWAVTSNKINVGDTQLDMEAVFLPGVFGIDAEIRLPGTARGLEKPGDSDLQGEALAALAKAITSRSGLIIGIQIPGDGEIDDGITSLFYPILRKLVSSQKRVVTVEGRIREKIRGAVQIEKAPSDAPSLAENAVLPSIVDAHPEVLMALDVENKEAAGLLTKAAVGGTLVLASVQAKDAVNGFCKFIDMSGHTVLLAQCIRYIIARKTVKKLCSSCREKYQPKPETLSVLSEKAGFKLDPGGEGTFYTAKGCKRCDNSGFIGIIGLHQIMPVSEALREALQEGKNEEQIRKVATREEAASLKYDSYTKALQGDISFEELVKQIG